MIFIKHVTYLAKRKSCIRGFGFYHPQKLCYTDIRITIDTKEDLEFMQRVLSGFKEHKISPDVKRMRTTLLFLE